MKVTFKGGYKSLKSFEWESSEDLVIITGENGSGKTQLLELIRIGLGPNFPTDDYYNNLEIDPETNQNYTNRFYLKISDFEFKHETYLNWNSLGRHLPVFPINYTYYQSFINWLFCCSKPGNDELRLKLNVGIPNTPLSEFSPENSHSSSGFEGLINGKQLKDKILTAISTSANVPVIALTLEDIYCHLPNNLIFNSINLDSNNLIEYYVFFYYMQKMAREKSSIETKSMGDDPIIVLNDVLKSCGLKYEVLPFDYATYLKSSVYESYLKVLPDFTLNMKKNGEEKVLNFVHLSSGEKIIVSLGFLEYYASYMKKSPSIMILDEIDAHLHPALIPVFFRVVNDILIKQFKTKVIMTTHNPSTIALAPKNDNCGIYKMSNWNNTALTIDNSKNHSFSINLLTEGLITVNEKTKYVFVEDEDDVDFYDNINQVNSISKRLVFIPSSNRTKKTDGSVSVHQDGGKDAVNKWINTFESLVGVFEGLIDKDSGNDIYSSNLNIIERYSIENYYFEPLVLFSFLNSAKTRKPEIESFQIVKGKEQDIILNKEKAQEIIKYIVCKLEAEVINQIASAMTKGLLKYSKSISSAEDSKNIIEVEYQNGIKYTYPEWLLYFRGKSLFAIFDTAFGSRPSIEQLFKHYNTIGLYPKELIDKLKNIA